MFSLICWILVLDSLCHFPARIMNNFRTALEQTPKSTEMIVRHAEG